MGFRLSRCHAGEHLDYHQVTDEPQYISYPDLARVTRWCNPERRFIANMAASPGSSLAPKQTNPVTPRCRQVDTRSRLHAVGEFHPFAASDANIARRVSGTRREVRDRLAAAMKATALLAAGDIPTEARF
jgi:hypothetical protein